MHTAFKTTGLILVFGFWCVLIVAATFTAYDLLFPAPEPVVTNQTSPTNCELLERLPGTSGYIEESQPGTYHYEVYSTADGVVVYKCRN